jgi:hypothetical protein
MTPHLNCIALDGRISTTRVNDEFIHFHFAIPFEERYGTWRIISHLDEAPIVFEHLAAAADYIHQHTEKWSWDVMFYGGFMMKVKNLRQRPEDTSHEYIGWYDENDDFHQSANIPEAAIQRDKEGFFWLFGALFFY